MTTHDLPDSVMLAELDGVSFLLVTAPAVFAMRDGQIAYYCPGSTWEQTEAAHEAAARAEVEQLRARLAELEARQGPALPLVDAAPALPAPAVPTAEPLPLTDPCRHCEKRLPMKAPHTLKMHERYCPKNPERGELRRGRKSSPDPEPAPAAAPPPPAVPPLRLAEDAAPKAAALA